LMEAQARELNPGFEMRMREGRPFVRCKLAMSLDGKTALANGESQWISSDESRMDVLADKQLDKERNFKKANFTGVTVPDRYVFGYGMDYKEYLRNAPGIYAVKEL